MTLHSRNLLKALPYTAAVALGLWLLPHTADRKGLTSPVWPGWGWLDAMAAMVAWVGTATILKRLDDGPPPAKPEYDGEELHLLAFSLLKAVGVTCVFAAIRWLLPSSRPGVTLGRDLPWFAWDASEYQFLVMIWTVGFLCLAYRDVSGLMEERAAAAARGPQAGAAGGACDDADWAELRRVVLEAAAGRRQPLPERLQRHRVARFVDGFFDTGDRALLDRAAAELTGEPETPWRRLTGEG